MVIVPGATDWPLPSTLVDLPDPFSEIQSALLRPRAIPHGFTRFGSVLSAIPVMSETRLVCVNAGAGGVAERRYGTITITAMAEAAATRSVLLEIFI
jgi:hypothetical protein